MRFRRVSAHAFGAFSGQHLDLEPGLNVVVGPNEAGKSTWHAALYLALCGFQRGRGRRGATPFDRYRPWSGDRWEVGTIVELADGRVVELRYDLDGRMALSVEDVDTGRSYLAEISTSGGPDGAHWLGLDRTAFLKTACVCQADLLDVLQEPKALQEHLQRAATSHNVDSTAAEALERLKRFHENKVGVNRANAVKPLRKAIERERAAQACLEEAQAALRDYLALEARIAELKASVDRAELELRIARAAWAFRQFDEERERLRRAEELAAQFPGGRPPSLRTDDDLAADVAAAIDAWQRRPPVQEPSGPTAAEIAAELARLPVEPPADRALFDEVTGAIDAWRNRPEPLVLGEPDLATLQAALAALPGSTGADRALDDEVAAAIDAWEHRPAPRPPSGPDAASIRAELDALPPVPSGDQEVAPTIEAAYAAVDEARRVIELHDRSRPDMAPLPETGGASPDELRDLARDLETEPPALDPVLEAEYERAQAAARRAPGVSLPLTIGAVALLVLGIALLLAGQPLPGAILALLGLIGALAVVLRSPQGSVDTGQLTALATRVELQRQAAAAAVARVAAARNRVQTLGLDPDPAALRRLAEQRMAAEAANRDAERWAALRDEYQRRLDEALDQLSRALEAHGLPVQDDPIAAYQDYAKACRARAEQARLAARRPELERQLELRLAADAAAAEIAERRAEAERRLVAVAGRCGVDATEPEAIALALRDWQQQRQQHMAAREARRAELTRQIAERKAAEAEAERIARTRDAITRRLRDVAARCGVAADSDEDCLVALQKWQGEWERHAADFARRPELERQLELRREADAAAASVARQHEEAARRLGEVAERCGLADAPADDLVAALRGWQARRAEAITQQEQALQAWGELESILSGRTLSEYKAAVSSLWESAQQLAEGLDSSAIHAALEAPDLDALLRDRQDALNAAQAAHASAVGQAKERERGLPSVAHAEEELAAARAEREQVEQLDRILTRTQEFLRQAEDQVHHNIAPVLAASIRRRLPDVTNGRYREARVDPQTLEVKVAGASGYFRPAKDLSHGTAEQVYLLLRVALAEWLTKPSESCPLILDDVTVQSDATRTVGILETLRTLSQERQVILFSQEEDVREWAEARQADGVHLIRLDGSLIPA